MRWSLGARPQVLLGEVGDEHPAAAWLGVSLDLSQETERSAPLYGQGQCIEQV
jgi:hypothetical protein